MMKSRLTILIIDDEEPARQLIRSWLNDFDQVEVIGECANGFEGVKAIQAQKPDLIFLDIQMPKISGFEMLELLDDYPQIIFSTAFDEYAIRAFEFNAVDYLLKPYSRERFAQAVMKAVERIEQKTGTLPGIRGIASGALPEGIYLDRLVVRSGQKIKVIPIDEVEYIEVEDDYALINTPEGRFMKQLTLGYLEAHLDPAEFLRVHRSCIVKLGCITQLEPYDKETKVLVMKSGKKIHTSKGGLKRLREQLGF